MGQDASTSWELIAATMRFQHLVQARLDRALSGLGLSFAQYEVLEILAAEPKLHAGEVGRRFRITRQAAHGLLVQLTRADLVDLLPKDGGVRGARLTQTGRRRLATCRRALEATERTLAALPAETQRSFLESLGACEEAFVPRLEPWWLE